ncbi:hypothetical protein ALC56_04172, partial [Trachymyrmex septentrionalis]
LTDDRYKSWIHRVLSDNNLYYCNVCTTFSCQSRNILKYADSTYHKNNIKKLCDNNDDNLVKKSKSVFQLKQIHIEECKHWLYEVPDDDSLCYCIICDKSFACGLSQIYNEKWMTFQVRSPDPETLNIRTQLDVLINMNFSILNFDDMWKKILRSNKVIKYPNLTNL